MLHTHCPFKSISFIKYMHIEGDLYTQVKVADGKFSLRFTKSVEYLMVVNIIVTRFAVRIRCMFNRQRYMYRQCCCACCVLRASTHMEVKYYGWDMHLKRSTSRNHQSHTHKHIQRRKRSRIAHST